MMCKYKLRWFYSKRAFLVLFWTLLLSFVSLSLYYLNVEVFAGKVSKWFLVLLVLTVLIAAPLSGWLANAKLGNYRVFKIGCVSLFVSTVMTCLVFVVKEFGFEISTVLVSIQFSFSVTFFIVGVWMCLVTVLQLGLDQMPDASSSNISSYIAWFVGATVAGMYLSYFTSSPSSCTHFKTIMVSPIVSLFLVLCMAIILVQQFFIPSKWLIIEPRSPQSLKTIYHILKFAKQNKAPLNRSSLTYWEEDIPSRVDLGKSRYGGPFTTEQVEDVKTLLRLMVISLPFFLITLSLGIRPNILSHIDFQIPGLNQCSAFVLLAFTYSSHWSSVLATIFCELVFYPLVGNKSPSLLQKIGFTSFMTSVVSFSCLIIKLVQYLDHSNENVSEWIARVIYFVTSGVLFQIFFTSGLEFACAQSPYHMRGLVLSFVIVFIVSGSVVGSSFGLYLSYQACEDQSSWCSVVPFAVKTVISLISLVLFCVVSRWYKMRVRDDGFAQQRIVEEVYDRYLTAEAARSNTQYGTVGLNNTVR